MPRKRVPPPSMADIVADVRVAKAREAVERAAEEAAAGPRRQFIDGSLFTVSDDEVTAEQAHQIAEQHRLVVYDACGCGGGCDYEIWDGKSVLDLTATGKPIVQDGYLWRIVGDDGRIGVLVEQDVRWGALH